MYITVPGQLSSSQGMCYECCRRKAILQGKKKVYHVAFPELHLRLLQPFIVAHLFLWKGYGVCDCQATFLELVTIVSLFSLDWYRPIEKRESEVLVHWWYFPDRLVSGKFLLTNPFCPFHRPAKPCTSHCVRLLQCLIWFLDFLVLCVFYMGP